MNYNKIIVFLFIKKGKENRLIVAIIHERDYSSTRMLGVAQKEQVRLNHNMI